LLALEELVVMYLAEQLFPRLMEGVQDIQDFLLMVGELAVIAEL
jgi:hypothetical protein